MDLKQTLTLLACCLLSAFLSVGIYRFFEKEVPIRLAGQDALAMPAPARVSLVSSEPNSFTTAAALTTPSVVYVRTYNQSSSRWEPNASVHASSGSGVIISADGLIATNNHVINGANSIKVMLSDQQEYEAEVMGIDPATDLALLRIEAENLPFITFGDSDSLNVGEWVLAIGNPFNLESTVTAGIVSAKGRSIDVLEGEDRIESFIQTDAAVNPGNSGGALVNERGQLIGINTAIITNSGRHEGFAFAIPGNLARRILRDLRDFGEVERAVIGVYVQKINARQAKRLGIPEAKGTIVTKLRQGGAAEAAGLEIGDLILSINDKSIASPGELQEIISTFRPGDRIKVDLIRDQEQEIAYITLRDKHNSTRTRRLVNTPNLDLLRQLGFELRPLSPNEQNKVGRNGIRVISVFRDSEIAATNMNAGFIITSANGMEVSLPEDILQLWDTNPVEITLAGIYEGYEGTYFYRLTTR